MTHFSAVGLAAAAAARRRRPEPAGPARGGRIERGLIPLDTVWRFGANAATTLHTDVDMTLGDVRLEAGGLLPVRPLCAGWHLVPESARPAQGYAELRGIPRIKWERAELNTTWRVAP
jgi:hypothetical protein